MKKVILLILLGFILTGAVFSGVLQAEEEGKEETKEDTYQLTKADKRHQLVSVFLILALMALTML